MPRHHYLGTLAGPLTPLSLPLRCAICARVRATDRTIRRRDGDGGQTVKVFACVRVCVEIESAAAEEEEEGEQRRTRA